MKSKSWYQIPSSQFPVLSCDFQKSSEWRNESLTDSQRLYTSENQSKALIWQSESQVKWGSLIQPSHYSTSDAICAVSQTCLAVTAGWQICFRASSVLENINMAAKRVPRVKPQRAQQQNCFHSKSVKNISKNISSKHINVTVQHSTFFASTCWSKGIIAVFILKGILPKIKHLSFTHPHVALFFQEFLDNYSSWFFFFFFFI